MQSSVSGHKLQFGFLGLQIKEPSSIKPCINSELFFLYRNFLVDLCILCNKFLLDLR